MSYLGVKKKRQEKKMEDKDSEENGWLWDDFPSLFGCLNYIENPPQTPKLKEYKKVNIGGCWMILEG